MTSSYPSVTAQGQLAAYVLSVVAKDFDKMAYAIGVVWPVQHYSEERVIEQLLQPNPLSTILDKVPDVLGNYWQPGTVRRVAGEAFRLVAAFAGADGGDKQAVCPPENVRAICRFINSGRTDMFHPDLAARDTPPRYQPGDLRRHHPAHQGQVVHQVLTQLAQQPDLMQAAFEMVWPPVRYDRDATTAKLMEANPLTATLNALAVRMQPDWEPREVYEVAALGIYNAANFCACDSKPGAPIDPENLRAVCNYIKSGRTDMFHP
jgi:hypothetical protein